MKFRNTVRPFDRLFDALQEHGHRLEIVGIASIGEKDKTTLVLVLEAVSGAYQGAERKVLAAMTVQPGEHIHSTAQRFHDVLLEKKVIH